MPKGANKRWARADAAEGATVLVTELGEIARTVVGQFVVFPISPQVLDRIELGRITRQPLDGEPLALGEDEVADHVRAVRRQSVPHHQELARQMAQQMAEEVDHLRAANGGGI